MNALFAKTLRENRRFLCLLLLLAAMALGLSLCGAEDLLAFPYAQIGDGLRWLSLSSAAGNVLAWVLLFVLGAIPAAVWLWLRKRGRLRGGDWALWVFAPVLLGTLYGMVNPGHLAVSLMMGRSGDFASVVQVALALTVDSFWLLYFVRRLMAASAQDGDMAPRTLTLLLRLLAAACAAMLGAVSLPEIFDACAGLDGAFSGTIIIGESVDFSLGAFLLALLSAAALALDTWLALMGITLLRLLQAEPYGEGTVAAAQAMAAFCRAAVTAILTALALTNLLTLLTLSDGGHIQLTLPVLTVAFALLMGLISRTLADRRALKQENELFI